MSIYNSEPKDLQRLTFYADSILNNFPCTYSEVPNRRADQNKRAGLEKSATLLAYLLSKLINEQGGIFRLLHEKFRDFRVCIFTVIYRLNFVHTYKIATV